MIKVSHVQDVDETGDVYVSIVVFKDDKNRYARDAVAKLLTDAKLLEKAMPGIKLAGLGYGKNKFPCPAFSGLTNNGVLIGKDGKQHKIGKEVRKCKGIMSGSTCVLPGDEFPELKYRDAQDAELCT